MFFELIATICAGVGAAGCVMLVRRLSGGAVPGWLTPTGAGLGMIAFAIWSEYSWYERNTELLPDGIEVVSVNESRKVYRPWTYMVPMVDRFIAVDTGTARTNPDMPGQQLLDVYLMGRWSPSYRVPMVLDCIGLRRADLIEGVELDGNGRVPDDAWQPLSADDPLIATACKKEIG
jgi:hypothetical protein